MKKGTLCVAFVGLLVTVVFAVAPLITGDSVAASPAVLERTLTDGEGSSCEIVLYADCNSEEVWGTVTTYTDDTLGTYTKAQVTLVSYWPDEYGDYWQAEAYWGDSDAVQISGDDTWYGYVKVRWEVTYPCGFWCWFFGGPETHVEFHYYWYSCGGWGDAGVKGLVGDAATGYPLPYAEVKAYQGSQLKGSDTSDQSGNYRILLDAGTYRLEASRVGYDPKTYYNVVVEEDEFTTKHIQLTPWGGGPPPL